MIASLAVATRTSPREWEQLLTDDPAMVATVVDLMREMRHGG